MMKAWYTFLVWMIFTRGRVVCIFKGHDWHNAVVCGFPEQTPRPLSVRCHRCSKTDLASNVKECLND